MRIYSLACHRGFCKSVDCQMGFELVNANIKKYLSHNYLEPFEGSLQQAGEDLFNVVDIVQLVGHRIGDINGEHLPVGFTLIDQCQNAEHFDLNDLTTRGDARTNFQSVDWIVVAFAAGRCVQMFRILPRLWQCTVIPDISVVWETVGYKAEFALLHILFDGIQSFTQRYLNET